jgi:serine protease SohB
MMAEILMQYGLFLAKAVTILAALAIAVALLMGFSRRERSAERLEVKHLNAKYESMGQLLKRETLPKKLFKQEAKAEKARRKAEKKQREGGTAKKRVFVLNFHGDLKATAVSSLREEVTAVLVSAKETDEIAVRLENAGGLVHEHGLATSQLLRVRQQGVPLSVLVDKVAASGGYMMACVADRIVAAPFAVIGSIGVLAQLPNFHRWLDRHGVDFELLKAGEFKRTLTLFGENTDAERQKMTEDLEDTHALFKELVAEYRQGVDVGKVATGEHWYGKRALELNLVDDLMTSDDYLVAASREAEIYEVSYAGKKTVGERLVSLMQLAAERLFQSAMRRTQDKFI